MLDLHVDGGHGTSKPEMIQADGLFGHVSCDFLKSKRVPHNDTVMAISDAMYLDNAL